MILDKHPFTIFLGLGSGVSYSIGGLALTKAALCRVLRARRLLKRGGRVLLTEMLLPRIARQGAASEFNKRIGSKSST